MQPESKIILVIDDEWDTREPVLKRLIGDRAEVRSISNSTRTAIRDGQVAPTITMEMIAQLRPAVIIFDLAIVPGDKGNPENGFKLMAKVRWHPLLRTTPILVISDFTEYKQAKKKLDALGVLGAFEWGRIKEGDPTVLGAFSSAIDKALNQASAGAGHE